MPAHAQETKPHLQVSECQPRPDVIGLVNYANTKADISMSHESFSGADWILKDWSLDECRKAVDELSASGVRELDPSVFWRKVYQVNGAREMVSRLDDLKQKSQGIDTDQPDSTRGI